MKISFFGECNYTMLFQGTFYIADNDEEQIEVLHAFDEDDTCVVLLVIDPYNRIEHVKYLCGKAEVSYSACFLQPGMKSDGKKWIYMNDVFDTATQDFIMEAGGIVAWF